MGVTDGISDEHKDQRILITIRGEVSSLSQDKVINTPLLRMPEMDQEQKAPEVAESDVKPGGLSFEVVLEDAKTSDKPAITASPEPPSLTAEELEKKLQEVEDRRKSLEAATLERLA